jgi:hypothetical protein
VYGAERRGICARSEATTPKSRWGKPKRSEASPTGFENELGSPGKREGDDFSEDLNEGQHEDALEAHGGPPSDPGVGQPDHLETALADAIGKAAAAGRFDVLPSLVAELEARRKARSGAVDLAVERARRGKR